MPRYLTGARRTLVSTVLLGVLLAACGGDSGTGSKASLVYTGVFAGEDGTEAGSFTANLVPEDSNGTGSFVVNGTTRSFTSITYDGTSIVAAGSNFTFTGTADDSTVTGDYTSPNGGGLFTGLKKVGSVTPAPFCGSHIGARAGVPLAGPFTFVQQGSSRRGVFTSVLGDDFRGLLSANVTSGPVSLDTLTGQASVQVSGSSFSGDYLMASGDSGAVAGSVCKSSVVTPIGTLVQGVLGSFLGDSIGAFGFNLSSTGVGSTGAYKVTDALDTVASVRNFVAVISGVNSQVAAFDSTFRIVLTIDTGTVEGTYSSGGAVAGAVAGLVNNGAPFPALCGTEAGTLGGGGPVAGAFAFLLRPDSSVFGLFTGGSSGFEGTVSGKAGSNATMFMEGFAEPAVLIADTSNFSGVFNFTGGPSGSLNGVRCP